MHFRLPALFALALLLSLPAAAQANPLGDLMRYSEIPANDDGAAYYPQIAFNAGTSEYLAAWDATDASFAPSDHEVYVQRIGKTGAQIGGDRRVSTIGAEGDTARGTFSAPGVAADPVNKRNLVVWASDHKVDSQFEVYGQLLDAAGNEIGASDFDISGEHNGTYYPAVAFNSVNQEYLVVWTGTVQIAPTQWGRRFDKNGAPLGPRFQFSSSAQSGNGSLPRIAYNAAANEYLVVWYSFKLGEDPEAYGQRIAANGTEIGGDIRLTTTGTATDDKKVYDPAIAYNPLAGNYLLTYERNDSAPNPALSEVYAQVLSATAVLQGSPLRLSAVGKRATEPRASYATSGGGAGQHLVVWAQDSPPRLRRLRDLGPADQVRRDRPGGSVPALRQRGGVHHAADGRRAQRRHRMALGVVLGLPERRQHSPAGRRGHGPPGRRGHDPERRRRLQAAGSRPGSGSDAHPQPNPRSGRQQPAARWQQPPARGPASPRSAAEAQGQGRPAPALHEEVREPPEVPDPAAHAEGHADRARDGEAQRQALQDREGQAADRGRRPARAPEGPLQGRDRDPDRRRPQGHGDAPLPHLRPEAQAVTRGWERGRHHLLHE